MKKISNQLYEGERSLFCSDGVQLENCTFGEGESPLKESRNVVLTDCVFEWKYPLWYCENVTVKNCRLGVNARAGVWYTKNASFTDCRIDAPKTFRKSSKLSLENVVFTAAGETLWSCNDVRIKNVTASQGDYFAMNSRSLEVENLTLYGNYSFDGAKDVVIRSSTLISKDAFWNSENVTVYDSYITGEYLGWNAKHLTLVNCTLESLQGFCYIDRLTLQNCKLINTTLAFEYSTVDADITGAVDSVLNPAGGTIRADHIGQLTIDRDRVDPTKTTVIVREDA